MVQTPQKVISLEEFLQLPETEPASEYIRPLAKVAQEDLILGRQSS